MSTRKAAVIAIVWALSLVGVSLWAQTTEHPVPPNTALKPLGANGMVLSGEDIGFRVTGPIQNGAVPGMWVGKIDGQWVKLGAPGIVAAGR